MITRPDEYGHQNSDLAFTDSDRVRGGRRVVADRAELYALASKADQLKVNVTMVRILSDDENNHATTEVLLVDAARIDAAAGWQLYAPAAAASPRRPPITFTDQVLVRVPWLGAYPPLTQAFDEDGNTIYCNPTINKTDKTLQYEFEEPTSGILIF